MTTQPPDSRKVFVVYGRNEQIREAIFGFLRTVGLDPIEWSEAIAMTGKTAPHIGEILDVAFSSAQAIVVVMTPDDEAKLQEPYQKDNDPPYEKELTPQPRPNVLFEAGLAMGRAPDRTVLVQIGNNIRPFSDIQGVHVVRLDSTQKSRKDLAQRLGNAGCPVNLKGDDWLETGNFEIHEKPDSTPAESSGKNDSAVSVPDAQRELEQTEVDVLTAIARKGEKGCSAAELARTLAIDVHRVQYFLDRLCESKHVSLEVFWAGFGSGVSHTYHLAKNGLAYLVAHNIV